MMTTPCFVITRDRPTYAKQCLTSLLEHGGDLEIHVVDHGTTYGPMLDYLESLDVPVHWRGNCMPRSLWRWQKLEEIAGDRRYLVTDPDIVFDENCPDDWLERLEDQLNRMDAPVKVGMGLKISDLPRDELGIKVKRWEERFWDWPQPDKLSYRAPVDTTLALHQPLSQYPDFILGPAIRLAPPYLIRHLPWYDGDKWYDDEYVFYRNQILPGSSHWSVRSW